MKKSLILSLLILLFTLSGFAQDKKSIEEMAQRRVDRVSEQVELSRKEKKQLLEHYRKIEAEKTKERELAQKEYERKQKEREQEIDKQNKELEKILGNEKFEELEKKRRETGIDDKRKDKMVDNFIDFIGNSMEMNERQKGRLREYYYEREDDLRKIIKRLESRKGDIEKILKDEEEKIEDIVKEEKEQITKSNFAI